MNVFLGGVRLGLGDVLARNFHFRRSAKLLAKLIDGFRSGEFDRIAIVPEVDGPVWNPASLEVFNALGIQSRHPDEVKGWTDIETVEFNPLEYAPVPLPTVKPNIAVPRKFILFNQTAGREDRCLDDPTLYPAIKRATRLPIAKVGRSRLFPLSPIPSDLDLTDRTTVPQTLWLAKHAVAIVSACSWMRNMTWGFGTPVIELVQIGHVVQETMDRTNKEYAENQYGMGNLNWWGTWPRQSDDLARILRLCVDREANGITTLWT